jgi:hypothetical protein
MSSRNRAATGWKGTGFFVFVMYANFTVSGLPTQPGPVRKNSRFCSCVPGA